MPISQPSMHLFYSMLQDFYGRENIQEKQNVLTYFCSFLDMHVGLVDKVFPTQCILFFEFIFPTLHVTKSDKITYARHSFL